MTVNIIDTLAPLLDDESDIPQSDARRAKNLSKWRVKTNSEDVCTSGSHPR